MSRNYLFDIGTELKDVPSKYLRRFHSLGFEADGNVLRPKEDGEVLGGNTGIPKLEALLIEVASFAKGTVVCVEGYVEGDALKYVLTGKGSVAVSRGKYTLRWGKPCRRLVPTK